ncbi:MAG: hypothetical protein ACOX1R_06795 [Caldicoprobacterales bacterium]|jgi:hypothetical protein|nr:PilN domain-containing protein [Clostridiales bacterium]
MKADINLAALTRSKYRNLSFISIPIVILVLAFSFLIPIWHRNSLRDEYAKISLELLEKEGYNREYTALEDYSMDLVKKVEILEKTDKKRGDVSIILDLIDNSFSRNIELLAITISKNTVTIKGVAPDDNTIADSILRLQEDKRVAKTRIEEISLDRANLKRLFSVRCITLLNDGNMDDILTWDDQEDSN